MLRKILDMEGREHCQNKEKQVSRRLSYRRNNPSHVDSVPICATRIVNELCI